LRPSTSIPLPARAVTPRRIVLDTNVVLDWLLFDDRRCRALADAITSRRVEWIASRSMHEELEHVLARGIASAKARDPSGVRSGWLRWATIVGPGDQPSLRGMRCSDESDQKFIDLALQVGAGALVSRDRAVLKLARRAALLGLSIVSVERWHDRVSDSSAG